MEFRLVRKLDICGVANVQFQDCKYRILHTTLTRETSGGRALTVPYCLFLCTSNIYFKYCYNYYFFKAPFGHGNHPHVCFILAVYWAAARK